jgi:hypothetical protein
MAITQAMCTSFKAELMLGVHDFRPTGDTGSDTFKLALYLDTADINANTTAYTATNESSGTNYSAGGSSLNNLGVVASNTNASAGVGFTDFSDLTFANVTVNAAGALIYNSTPSANSNANAALTNASVCVLNFGGTKTSTDGDFTIIFPTASNSAAIIRIA